MAAPVPRDPRAPRTTPQEVSQRFEEILDEPTSTIAEDADRLARAHAVLSEALNDN